MTPIMQIVIFFQVKKKGNSNRFIDNFSERIRTGVLKSFNEREIGCKTQGKQCLDFHIL